MPALIDKPMHVIGAGGIGVALAWALASRGRSVVLVDAHAGKVQAGREDGVTVVGQGTQRIPMRAFDDWNPPREQFVLLCTKTYDNPAVLDRLPDNPFLLPVQNGFDSALDRRSHAGEGIASFVSECQRDRPVTRITRPGHLHIGGRRANTAEERGELTSLADVLGRAGLFSVESVTDVRPYKATKLMYNAAISPLAACAGVDNGQLLSDPLAKTLFFAMLRENYAILRHARTPLARIGPFHPDTVSWILRIPGLAHLMAVFFRPSLRGTYCSMAPDIPTGRTEIEAYNGHLIRLADTFPCPLNRAARALVEKLTRQGLAPDRQYLEQMAADLPREVQL